MIEDHQRAALMPNDPKVAWHHFLLSRFVGREPERGGDASFGVIVQTVAQQSGIDAEWSGLVEVGAGGSLPVVFEFTGTLDLETRELTIQQANPARQSYVGRLSENGRVITLQAVSAEGKKSKTFHLVHEETLTRLEAE